MFCSSKIIYSDQSCIRWNKSLQEGILVSKFLQSHHMGYQRPWHEKRVQKTERDLWPSAARRARLVLLNNISPEIQGRLWLCILGAIVELVSSGFKGSACPPQVPGRSPRRFQMSKRPLGGITHSHRLLLSPWCCCTGRGWVIMQSAWWMANNQEIIAKWMCEAKNLCKP